MGRPRKNAAPEEAVKTTTSTEKEPKVADRVAKEIASAKKANGGKELTREQLTEACMTPKDMIDENGIFMGEDYQSIIKKPNGLKLIEGMKNRTKYDPNKESMWVRVYFTNTLLAVAPGDPELMASHLAKMSMDAQTRDEQVQTIGAQAVANKQREVFERRSNGRLIWSAHRWLGFFKARCEALRKDLDTEAASMTAYKNVLNENISFTAQYYPINLPKGGEISILDRPMPGDGYKRETSIKSSEAAPAGTTTSFIVQSNVTNAGAKKKGSKEVSIFEVLAQCLDSGVEYGTGGWRGSGKRGQFLWESLDEDGHVSGGNTKEYLGVTSEDPDFKEAFYAYIESRTFEDIDDFQL